MQMSNSGRKGVESASAISVTRCRVLQRACLFSSLFFAAALFAFEPVFGPFYSEFDLTLEEGNRSEILGPFFYKEDRAESSTWAVPPLFSTATDRGIDSREVDLLYPVLT